METQQSERTNSERMRCPACGSRLQDGAGHCPQCGQSLPGGTALVAGIPVIPLTASAAGPPAAADVPLRPPEPETPELPAAPFCGYRPVMPLLPVRRHHDGRVRAMLAGLALVIVLVAALALAHAGLHVP